MWFHLAPLKMTYVKVKISHVGKDMKQLELRCIVDMSVRCTTSSENSSKVYFIALTIHPPFDPATLLLDIYIIKMKTYIFLPKKMYQDFLK